jgi:hypothetical protein
MYSLLLKRAFHILKENKKLMVFGLFTALLGNGGAYEALVNTVLDIQENNTFWQRTENTIERLHIFSAEFWKNTLSLAQTSTGDFILSISTFLAILLMIFLMVSSVIISQIALIRSVEMTERKKTFRLNDLLSPLKTFLTPVFFINFLAIIILLLFREFSGYMSEEIVTKAPQWSTAITFLLLIFNIGISLIIYFSALFASIEIVFKRTPFLLSVKRGVRLFFNHFHTNIELTLLLFFIQLATSFGTFLLGILASLPFFILSILSFFYGFVVVGFIFLFLVFLIFILLFALMFAALAAFQTITWTLLYEELKKETKFQPLIRFFTKEL